MLACDSDAFARWDAAQTLCVRLVRSLAAARAADLYTNLITSAIGLTRDRAAELKAAGLDSVQISFQADQRIGHQPVHLVPGFADGRGDRGAEDFDDRLEEISVHDLVLLGGDAERGVLVRDPR